MLSLLFLAGCSDTAITIDENLVCDPINEDDCIEVKNGNAQVNMGDQTTPPFFIKASQVTGVTSLAANTNMTSDPYTVIINVGSTIAVGDYIGIFNINNSRFYVGTVLNLVGTTLTLDTPLDSNFKTNDVLGFGFTNWAVDGSTTPQIFSVRGADPQLNITLDITRVLFTCLTSTALQLTDFGDIAGGLTRGLVLRRVDGTIQNYVNFKNNIEMKGWMLDWENLDDSNPGQGLHGFVARLTFAGQEKLGVATRIGPGEEFQLLVQDPLQSLLSCEMMVEGHQTN